MAMSSRTASFYLLVLLTLCLLATMGEGRFTGRLSRHKRKKGQGIPDIVVHVAKNALGKVVKFFGDAFDVNDDKRPPPTPAPPKNGVSSLCTTLNIIITAGWVLVICLRLKL